MSNSAEFIYDLGYEEAKKDMKNKIHEARIEGGIETYRILLGIYEKQGTDALVKAVTTFGSRMITD